jgi:site-specific DNA recombinase
MLKNETYVGTRYFNRLKAVKGITPEGRCIPRKSVERDRSEWIGVKVPAIISQELFDQVQVRLHETARGYRQPPRRYLLGQFIECGQCGRACSSYRRSIKIPLVNERCRVDQKATYKCNRRIKQASHVRGLSERCFNKEIATHVLEGTVFDMLRETLFDPVRLYARSELLRAGEHHDQSTIPARLKRLQRRIEHIHTEKARLIDLYAAGIVPETDYASQNIALDEEVKLLTLKAAELKPLLNRQDIIETSFRVFCQTAKDRFQSSVDFDTQRQFLRDHIEKIVFDGDKVAIVGSVPLIDPAQSGGPAKVAFRIDGRVDSKKYRKPGKRNSRLATGAVVLSRSLGYHATNFKSSAA